MAHRQFRLSLAAIPEIRTAGSFANGDERIAWVQPSDLWHVHWPSHGGSFTMNGKTFAFEPHSVIVVPPGSRCEVIRHGRTMYTYCYFSFVPTSSEQDTVSLPVCSQLERPQADWLEKQFRHALNRQQWSRTGLAAIAYALLWSVATPEFVHLKSLTTEQAEALISDRLGGRILVRELADELRISQSQLTRAFLQDHGRTPLQYIKDRRAQVAHRLLTRTMTPIKQVALSCGIPDSNQFYRFIKERYGASPRQLRREQGIVDVFRAGDLPAARSEE